MSASKKVKYADGFCPECSEYCRPLTLALGEEGVPTGAKDWPSTWGVLKIKEFHDLHYALNRLMNAMKDGNKELIHRATEDVKFYQELHRRRYKELLERHQAARDQQESPSVELAPDSDKGPCSQTNTDSQVAWLCANELWDGLQIRSTAEMTIGEVQAVILAAIVKAKQPPSSDVTHGIEKELADDLRKAIGNDRDNHDGMDEDSRHPEDTMIALDDTECFCVRCCAIRYLASIQKPEEGGCEQTY